MDILWHGCSCITIKAKGISIVFNPYSEKMGLKLPKLKADIAILTKNYDGYDNISALDGNPYVIDWPGEYEVKGAAIQSFPVSGTDGIFTTIYIDGLKICFIEKVLRELDDVLIENIGNVDILILSIGDPQAINAEKAHKIMEKIEPRCVIPVNYAIDDSETSLETAEKFLKIVGAVEKEKTDKFTVQTRSSFKEDITEIVVLRPQVEV